MKRAMISGVSALVCAIAVLSNASAADLTGREIMEKQESIHDRPVEFSETRMVLIDCSGTEKERTLHSFARTFEDGLTKTLIVFTEPTSVKGVASLTWAKEKGDDDQWTYIPALKKLKRVVGGGKRSYFMGTDFANEDLTRENLSNFRYERQADAVVDGHDSYVVDAYPETPETEKNSGYDHRRLYIRKDIFFATKTEFFERRSNKLLKTLNVLELKNIEGDVWRAKVSLMENHKEDHKTRTEVLRWDFSDSAVDPDIFKHRYLKSQKHMR